MSVSLNKAQIDDLLIFCNTEPRLWKDDETLVCCPVHGESHPSMGISEEKQICHCFSCSFAGDFAKLLLYSLPDTFGFDRSTPESTKKTEFRAYRKARKFLAERYELEYHEVTLLHKSINRYEEHINKYLEEEEKREVLPKFKLAPFMSGKETYQYFFSRGFTKENMKTFMIGRDTDNKTITIPVFYEDNQLAGVIGRYISSNRRKNERYKIYNNFNRSNLLYPLNVAKPIRDTIILVEGQLDAIYMHNLGHTNTYAIMTNQLSNKQADWIITHCSTVIWVGDNDERGLEGRDKAKKLLKNKVEFKIVDYPSYGKDVCDWSKEDIDEMISNAHGTLVRRIKRLD